LWVLLGRAEEDRRSGPEPLGSGVPRISTWTRPGCIGALPRARLARRGAPGARRLNPKTSFVVRITTGPVGLAWRLPLSHWVDGALESPTPTPVSTWNTRSSICDHGGEAPRRAGPWGQKPSPPSLRPRAPFNTPLGPLCTAVRRVGLRAAPAPPAALAASPIIGIQTCRITELWMHGSDDHGWRPGALFIVQSLGGNCRPGAPVFQAG
jgi:hypothetical protein